jgi:DNA-binding ferritin-like protein
MDDLKKSQESMGTAAAGVKKQVSEAATDAKEKLTALGGDAVGQLSDLAQTATEKAKAAADYLRKTELKAMAEDVKDIVKRYPGWTLTAAAVIGFLLAHVGSRNTNRFSKYY